MKRFYVITYDLSGSKKDHTSFFEKLKELGGWMHYIRDTWVISTYTYSSAEQIFRQLEPLIDKQEDYLLVVKIDQNDKQGWLPKEGWDWFQK